MSIISAIQTKLLFQIVLVDIGTIGLLFQKLKYSSQLRSFNSETIDTMKNNSSARKLLAAIYLLFFRLPLFFS